MIEMIKSPTPSAPLWQQDKGQVVLLHGNWSVGYQRRTHFIVYRQQKPHHSMSLIIARDMSHNPRVRTNIYTCHHTIINIAHDSWGPLYMETVSMEIGICYTQIITAFLHHQDSRVNVIYVWWTKCCMLHAWAWH